jgi:hypothetical protein
MMWPITMSNTARINWGRVLNVFNVCLIAAAIVYKITYIKNHEDKFTFTDKKKAYDSYSWHKSCGYEMKELKEPSVTTTGSTQSYEFTLVEFESIIFECIALVVSLFAFTSYQLMQQTIAKLKDTSYREEVLLL